MTKDINPQVAFFQKIGLADKKGRLDLEKTKAAYHQAHKNRDFEIELYWKRATYFWGFQVSFFATVGIVLSTETLEVWQYSYMAWISLVAFIVTALWALMSNGAKFWQANWEAYVDILEPYVVGDIYKFFPSRKKLDRPYSVSKVNSCVIFVIGVFWCLAYLVFGSAAICQVEGSPPAMACTLVCFILGLLAIGFFTVQLRGSYAWTGFKNGNPKDSTFDQPVISSETFHLYKRSHIFEPHGKK
ncbi:hypothetical protein [Celeribacter baekdonensis]|uniref:RipA family octameric membrane protein n=1 Tax=Celeribacter baekdonensis TaxID=875171 RepID=UPI003A94A96D